MATDVAAIADLALLRMRCRRTNVAGTGPAETASKFTYTAPASGNFSHTTTAATSEGTTYSSATLTASK